MIVLIKRLHANISFFITLQKMGIGNNASGK